MVARKEKPPLLILVVVPVVIIAVIFIVDADLNTGLLWHGRGYEDTGAASAAVRNNEAM